MWLHQKVYGFALSDGTKLEVHGKEMNNLMLVVNEKVTDIPIGKLFKGAPSNGDYTLKGYSILEYLNINGDIDIDGKLVNIHFVKNQVNYKLIGFKNPQIILNDKELKQDEMKEIETLLINSIPVIDETAASSVEEVAPVQEQPLQAVAESAEESVEEKVVLFENEDYEDEKSEYIGNEYKEYNTEPKSNYRLLVKSNRRVLIEITEDDYNPLEIDDYNINISEGVFTIERVNVEA